jgi:hypothetical protein
MDKFRKLKGYHGLEINGMGMRHKAGVTKFLKRRVSKIVRRYNKALCVNSD